MATLKRLFLMRHAKASPYEPGADRNRPLVERGRSDARAMGEHLRAAGMAPALVLCSPAIRTRETLDAIMPALGEATDVRTEPRLYGASADALLRVVHDIDESVSEAMLVGHNPGMHDLAVNLAAAGDRIAEIETKFPTAAVAELTFEGLWALLAPDGAELASFAVPSQLR